MATAVVKASKTVKAGVSLVRAHLDAVEKARETYLAAIKRAEADYFERIKKATEIVASETSEPDQPQVQLSVNAVENSG